MIKISPSMICKLPSKYCARIVSCIWCQFSWTRVCLNICLFARSYNYINIKSFHIFVHQVNNCWGSRYRKLPKMIKKYGLKNFWNMLTGNHQNQSMCKTKHLFTCKFLAQTPCPEKTFAVMPLAKLLLGR